MTNQTITRNPMHATLQALQSENGALKNALRAAEQEIEDLRIRIQDLCHLDTTRLWLITGITRTETKVLQMLFNIKGVATKEQLYDGLYWDGQSVPEPKIIDVLICKLRSKLPPKSITTIWGRGYHLTSIGRNYVEKAREYVD